MSSRHSSFRRRYEGTCLWVLKLKEYQKWSSNTCGLLWIKGKPGAGKSTLLVFLSEMPGTSHAESDTIYLQFFFHARGEALQHTGIGMFRALLFQIFHRDESIREKVRNIYVRNTGLGNGGELAQSQLEQVFEEAVLASALTQQVVIFIDALDEAGATSALELATYFHKLNAHAVKEKLKLKICISCRHYPVPSTRPAVEITVEDHNSNDIANYLRDNIFTSPSVPETRLANQLIEQSGNMFQWVRIILPFVQQRLAEGDSPGAVLDWLEEIPTPQEDMNDTYQYILEHVIANWNWKQSFLLFQWVYLAERPLTPAEIPYALTASNARAKNYPEESRDVKYPLEANNLTLKIKALSGGLAEIVSVERDRKVIQIIQVIHQSVNDFLYQKGLPWLADRVGAQPLSTGNDHVILKCQKTLYQSCLDYLTIESLQGLKTQGYENRGSVYKEKKFEEEILPGRPFIHYAVKNIFIHARKAQGSRIMREIEDSESHSDALNEDLQSLEDIFDLWLKIYRMVDSTSSCPPKGSHLVQIATAANMSDIVDILITSNEESLTETDSDGNTLFHIASQHGRVKLAQMLKQRGSSCLAKNGHNETPLVLALRNDHLELARWLLKEMKKSSATIELNMALQEACYKGQRGMIRLLKAADASVSVNFEGGQYGSALQAAASSGRTEVMKVLLNDDMARVDIQGGEFGNSLQAAAWAMDLEGVKLLLHFHAEVNQRGGKYDTPLQAAALKGSLDIVKCLLDAGANVNSKGGLYGSAIQAVCRSRSTETMEILVKHGADINSYGDEDLTTIQSYTEHDWSRLGSSKGRYCTPLQTAARLHRLDIVKFLIYLDANVNQRGSENQTALYTAAYHGSTDIAKCLIDAGAEVTVKGGIHGTALQAAAGQGETEIMKMLIDAGADVNASGGARGNALSAAAAWNEFEAAKILIEAKANVYDQVGNNFLPLENAVYYKSADIMRLILQANPDVTLHKERYGRALYHAREEGFEEGAEILEKVGVLLEWDPFENPDQRGRSKFFGIHRATRV